MQVPRFHASGPPGFAKRATARIRSSGPGSSVIALVRCIIRVAGTQGSRRTFLCASERKTELLPRRSHTFLLRFCSSVPWKEGGLSGRYSDYRRLFERCMKRQPERFLSQHELAAAYAETLRFVSISKRLIPSDETRQYMADAIRKFYELLDARLESKRIQRVAGTHWPKTKRSRNLSDRDAA